MSNPSSGYPGNPNYNAPSQGSNDLRSTIFNMAQDRYQKVAADAITKQFRDDMGRVQSATGGRPNIQPGAPDSSSQAPQLDPSNDSCRFCKQNTPSTCPTCGQNTACKSCQMQAASRRQQRQGQGG